MDTVSVKTDSQSICARGVGCIHYLTVPYLTYTFYEDGRGRTISFPDATRHTSRLQPRLLRLAHGGSTTYLFFIQFQYPHSDILKPKKSTCQTVITATSFHPRVGIITIYTNPVESDHAISTFPTFPSFFLHACDGVCNSLSETISIYFFPDPPSDLSHLQTKDKIRYEDNDTGKKACCLRHLDEEEVFGCE